MNIDLLQRNIVDWADGISSLRRPTDAVVKLVGEASELLDAVVNNKDVEGEIGDCLILLLDLADMYGIDPVKAGFRKMEINRARKWVADGTVIRRERGHNGAD